MYRITIYENDNKNVEEFGDEDELRERVDDCLNDLEHRRIKTFSVSWISQSPYKKPFWDK